MPFNFIKTEIADVIIAEPKVFGDHRGYFYESYKASEFSANGIPDIFIQDNISMSVRGVLRGLHYQLPPHAQAKLVRCTKGEIFDVAVDIRRNSPTFGKYVSTLLTENNHRMLYIPAGFAHGFLVLSETAELHYKASDEYSPASERGIIFNDKDINISWPHTNVTLSEKDVKQPNLCDAEIF